MELLPFVDILKVFNNPINEEQAWAVCYQCANFMCQNQKQEYYQIVCEFGIQSIWLSRDGDVLLRKGPQDPNGSGKGPPHGPHNPHGSTVLARRRRHVIATETDAVQALGTSIFEALDYGIDASEERQLSQGLEYLIVTMTNADNSLDYDPDAINADDEGIEKDADIEHRCTLHEVLKLCSQHLSSKQDAQHHYKAVCRALATEAGELFTFLDKIATSKEKLSDVQDEDSRRLEELQRADWACLWVQVMRSLRQGVRLKKVEHVTLPPLEYELTPFEMLLEDIRSRRYTLHKIMVNGEIPSKVKSNAHAVILDFIRSRPPLKKVHERKLKPKPPSVSDPHELLLKEIRSRPQLRPVKDGRLLVAMPHLNNDDDLEPPRPVKKIIKADLNLLLNNSFEESSSDDDHSGISSMTSSPLSSLSPGSTSTMSPSSTWQRSGTRESFLQDSSHRPTRLQRRHTIMVCESPMDGKVPTQELPPLEEEEEPSPIREIHHFSHQSVPKHLHGPALLHRTSLSDNDLSIQVTLRNPQGHARRSSLEHRRSLTSLNSGLSAIPEMEDNHSGTDLLSKSSGTVLRSRSQEQAPPPNPSPPCKGRARAALGMSMAGMKPVGGPYHPGSHRQHASPSSPLTPQNLTPSPTTPPSMACDSVQNSTHSAHVLKSSSPHASPVVPSSPLSSLPTAHPTTLDSTVSSQSPGYTRKWRTPPQDQTVQNGPFPCSDIKYDPHTECLRSPFARKERFNSKGKQDKKTTDEFEDKNLFSDQVSFSEEGAHSRRLSLDSRVDVYIDSSNVNSDSKTPRRLSLSGQKKGVSQPADRKIKSPDEEERLRRWRTLQEEDLASRKIIGKGVTNRHCAKDMTSQQRAGESGDHMIQKRSVLNKKSTRGPANQAVDALEQNILDKEARFERWRQLVETGGRSSSTTTTDEDDTAWLSTVDREYVSDVLSARLQPAAPANSVVTTSNASPLHGVLPLPKRWQNPIECLSLTLEEVTHIRSVLTKAELESLISHPDIYQQVSKGKLCFTCKTTRFTLFGEWGTKCKFCKKTVCSKCLRKMNVPSDQFKHVPVYTLCPSPLTPEMQELVQSLIKTAPSPSVPTTRSVSPSRNIPSKNQPQSQQKPTQLPLETSPGEDDDKTPKGLTSRSKNLQRSQSLYVPSQKQALGSPRTIKGPTMAICCDCKGMVAEIIRATQASLAMLSSSSPMLQSQFQGPTTNFSCS